MALATWGDLKSALTNWLARSDQVARYPEWCSLVEADIRRKLRYPMMETNVVTVNGTRELVLASADVQEIDHIRYGAGQAYAGVLTKLSADDLQSTIKPGTGAPTAYCVTADPTTNRAKIAFDIVPNSAYTLVVTGYSFTALNTAADGNSTALMLRSPDLYLYGILAQSAPYIEHDERLATWQAFYQNALDGENLAMERLQLGGGAKPISLPVVFG